MKNCKTFYEAQTASRVKEIIQLPPIHPPPPSDKILLTSLEQKFSDEDRQKYTDICFHSTSKMQCLDVKKWCSANVFSDIK